MPSRLPLLSTSAPPELPGLMAASVWMKFSKVLMPSWLRPSALTMPEVTVWPTSNGLPMASTTSPTWMLVGVAEGDHRQPVEVDLQHRDVGLGVGADQPGLGLAAVRQLHLDVVGALDDMVVGEQVAFGRDDHARAEADLPLARIVLPPCRSPKKKRNHGSSAVRIARAGARLVVTLTTAGVARRAAAL